MAIKHVITRGYGFSDGTVFLPTRGYGSLGTQLINSLSGMVGIRPYLGGQANTKPYLGGDAGMSAYLSGRAGTLPYMDGDAGISSGES